MPRAMRKLIANFMRSRTSPHKRIGIGLAMLVANGIGKKPPIKTHRRVQRMSVATLQAPDA
jgi:hypothetical protein